MVRAEMRDQAAAVARARVEIDDDRVEPLLCGGLLCRRHVLHLHRAVAGLDERLGQHVRERAILDHEQNRAPRSLDAR